MLVSRRIIVCSSAVALFAFGAIGAPGSVAAQQVERVCNPVMDGRGEPVQAGVDDVVRHGGSFVCPEPVAAVEAPPVVAEVEPAAPPPALPESEVVYFPLDVAELTDEARQRIGGLLQEVQQTEIEIAGVTVEGHTDTTGPAEYNQALSERRAQNVAAELIRAGIPARVIETQGFGQTRLAVPTEDEVLMQENRRAVINMNYRGGPTA